MAPAPHQDYDAYKKELPIFDVKLLNKWTFEHLHVQVLKYRHMYVKVNLLNKLYIYIYIYIYDCFLLYFNLAGLEDYIRGDATKHATYIPLTAGRYSAKRFRKAQCPIVERLVNALMMLGRNNGKKLMAVRIVKHAIYGDYQPSYCPKPRSSH